MEANTIPTQKAVPELLHENDYRHGEDNTERVVAIEYHPEGRRRMLLPFSVFTVQQKNPTVGWIAGLYDFDWCKRDQTLYYHCSGSGGSFYLHPFCDPKKKPRAAVWWDHALISPTNGRIKQRILSERTVRKYGYDILPQPVPLFDNGLNPFENALRDETEYCGRCNDHLPVENLCDHVWWCGECGTYSSPGDRCKHRRTER